MPVSYTHLSAGSLINAAGFHADNTILYDIDDADSVLCAQLVQSADDVGNLHLYTVYALPVSYTHLEWENRLENGVWTYRLEEIWEGLQDSYDKLAEDVKNTYQIQLTRLGAVSYTHLDVYKRQIQHNRTEVNT